MLTRPKNLSCPSRNCMSLPKALRQPPGDRKGKSPSNTSTSASAIQIVSPDNAAYFLRDSAAAPPPVPPRNARKKSEPWGSITTTSLRLLKLCL
jgi:hypothetical protein